MVEKFITDALQKHSRRISSGSQLSTRHDRTLDGHWAVAQNLCRALVHAIFLNELLNHFAGVARLAHHLRLESQWLIFTFIADALQKHSRRISSGNQPSACHDRLLDGHWAT